MTKAPAIAWAHRAVEAGPSAGVARSACLLDPDPDRVLIAIQAHLDHALDMAGSFAFAPQRVAGAAEYHASPLAMVLRKASSFMCATISTRRSPRR